MLQKFFLVSGLMVAAFVQGCTSLADVKAARGGGLQRTYNVEFDRAWEAAIAGVRASGLSLAAENKAEGYILAERGPTAFSWGENVAIFTKKVSARQTTVEVVSKKALATNITAADWTQDLFNQIDQRLRN